MGNCGACHESGAPVRSETRISKIFFGSSMNKVLLRQTTGNQRKTSSFVRDVRFLGRSRVVVIAQSILFLVNLTIFHKFNHQNFKTSDHNF